MKSLSSEIYNKKYFLTDCSDFEEFKKSYGKSLGPRIKRILSYIYVKKGMKILDIGCGRGEAAFWAANKGAEVIGIDYSQAGIKLAKKALAKQPKKIQKRIKFLVVNAKDIKFAKNRFDLVLIIDVLEHLYNAEQDIMINRCYNILCKSGIILAHTEPNKMYLDYFYKYWSYPMSSLLIFFWKIISKKNYPNIPHPSITRTESHKLMHINEPTYSQLQKIFKNNGFKIKIHTKNFKIKPIISCKDIMYNFLVFLYPFSKYFPLNKYFAEDFIVIAKKN